jgi:hypothetical protein
MPTRWLLTDETRRLVKEGHLFVAIFNAAADLELLAFEKLLFEKQLPGKLIVNWNLYTSIRWCFELKLFDEKWKEEIDAFRNLRNNAAHHRNFHAMLEKSPEKQEEVRKLVLSICDFIDNTRTKYKWNPELEKQYGKSKRLH